ncbi:MAG: VOC family protein [Isosphaeraceae bacterium]|nr:VOC family protein [Isosphaeraceae bacterium]
MNRIQNLVEAAAYVDDLDRAEHFYRDVLGLPLLGKEAGRQVFFQVGDRAVLLLFLPESTLKGDHLPPHGARGPGHFALGIPAESLDSWRTRLSNFGVPVEHEESWPAGGHSLYFRDPAGNLVELVTPGIWNLPTGW